MAHHSHSKTSTDDCLQATRPDKADYGPNNANVDDGYPSNL